MLFRTNVRIRKKRQIPPNPQINVNLALQMPPGITPQQLPDNIQQILNNLVNQVAKVIPDIVRQEILRQSPIIGIEARVYGGKWIDETPAGGVTT